MKEKKSVFPYPVYGKYRDKKTYLLYNNPEEIRIMKKQMNRIFDYIWVSYLVWNYEIRKYNITTAYFINYDKHTLKNQLEYGKKYWIKNLNNEYKRKKELGQKDLEAVRLIGFYLSD